MSLTRKLLEFLLFVVLISGISISFIGCGGVQASKAPQPPVTAGPQGTFVYVGEEANDPASITPTLNMDSLASYQVQADGSLKKLGAFDRSLFPAATFESAAAGQWIFTCDERPVCQEFRIDSTGNLARGADISGLGLHQVGGIDPTATWLIASSMQGEQAFRIQADGTLLPGPKTPVPLPAPPASPDILSFFIIAFDITGNFVFARDTLNLSDPPGIFRFDSSSGTFTRTGPLLPELTAIDFHFMGFTSDARHAIGVQKTSTGTVGDVYIFDWDPNAGNLSIHSHSILNVPDVTGFFPGFMAMADNMVFMQGGFDQNVVFRFDPVTGTLSDTGQRFAKDTVTANAPMRADSKTHTVFSTSEGGNLLGVWKYDPATGVTRAVPGSPFATGQSPEIFGLVAH